MTTTQFFFLLDYKPASERFTSFEEVEKIKENLCLTTKTLEDMLATRNEVVEFYSDAYERESNKGNTDEAYSLWNAMQSVTAAIDYVSHGATA